MFQTIDVLDGRSQEASIQVPDTELTAQAVHSCHRRTEPRMGQRETIRPRWNDIIACGSLHSDTTRPRPYEPTKGDSDDGGAAGGVPEAIHWPSETAFDAMGGCMARRRPVRVDRLDGVLDLGIGHVQLFMAGSPCRRHVEDIVGRR